MGVGGKEGVPSTLSSSDCRFVVLHSKIRPAAPKGKWWGGTTLAPEGGNK